MKPLPVKPLRVLIGAETYRRLPVGTIATPMPGLNVKGKDDSVDAYIMHALPA